MKTIGYVIAILAFALCGDAEAQLFQRQPVRSLIARISGVQASCSSSQTVASCSGAESFSVVQSCSGAAAVSYSMIECAPMQSTILQKIADAQPVRSTLRAIVGQQRCEDGQCQNVKTATLYSFSLPTKVEPTPDDAPMVTALGSGYFRDRIQFKRGLLQACQRAEDKSDVPQGTTFALGRRLRLHPGELSDIMDDVRENAEAKGIMAPDWNAFLDFLEKLIPIIIKLIDLFAMDVDTACDVAMALSPEQVQFWLNA